MHRESTVFTATVALVTGEREREGGLEIVIHTNIETLEHNQRTLSLTIITRTYPFRGREWVVVEHTHTHTHTHTVASTLS